MVHLQLCMLCYLVCFQQKRTSVLSSQPPLAFAIQCLEKLSQASFWLHRLQNPFLLRNLLIYSTVNYCRASSHTISALPSSYHDPGGISTDYPWKPFLHQDNQK